jgi:hypothetical protein
VTEVTGMELVLPHSGELIDPADLDRLADAYGEIQQLQARLADAKRTIGGIMEEHTAVVGAKTFRTPNGRTIRIEGGSQTRYDAVQLMDDLRAAGMPEDQIMECVIEEVSWKVDARRAKQAARANERYAEAVERSAQIIPTTPRVVVS